MIAGGRRLHCSTLRLPEGRIAQRLQTAAQAPLRRELLGCLAATDVSGERPEGSQYTTTVFPHTAEVDSRGQRRASVQTKRGPVLVGGELVHALDVAALRVWKNLEQTWHCTRSSPSTASTPSSPEKGATSPSSGSRRARPVDSTARVGNGRTDRICARRTGQRPSSTPGQRGIKGQPDEPMVYLAANRNPGGVGRRPHAPRAFSATLSGWLLENLLTGLIPRPRAYAARA